MKSKFLWSWTSWSSPLGKLFPAHLFAERDGTRRRRLGQGPIGQLWVPGSGAQMSTLQTNACTRRNSRGNLPRSGPQSCSAPALSPGLHLEPPFFCGAQKVSARYPKTRAFPRGPNTPDQDALGNLVRPLQSTREPKSSQNGWRARLPPSLCPLPEAEPGRTYR